MKRLADLLGTIQYGCNVMVAAAEIVAVVDISEMAERLSSEEPPRKNYIPPDHVCIILLRAWDAAALHFETLL